MTSQQDAYAEGKAQQALIMAAKPDWTREQWEAEATDLQERMDAAVVAVERLRGRFDAVGLHLLYAKMPRPQYPPF